MYFCKKILKMYRTNTCGELRLQDIGKEVVLSGWVQKNRDLGSLTFIDLRDRYGTTQIVFNTDTNPQLCEKARKIGREWVIQVKGKVAERYSKNYNIPTGQIEIIAQELTVLSQSEVPPFTIEDQTDGGEELLLKFRYLDLRRNQRKEALILRHKMSLLVRNYLSMQNFVEIETPFLINSTPEGARDFVVPSRLHIGSFYALPQSPQIFKQLLMVAGFDRYYQIVKCFRDEDLRADRQPEFTQIDCEMSFVHQNDVLEVFEGLMKYLFKEVKAIEFTEPFERMPYKTAIEKYGSDKPDLRFNLQINEITQYVKGNNFSLFDQAQYIGAIVVDNANQQISRKTIDALTEFVKRPQIGGQGLIWLRYNSDQTIKSSIDKYFNADQLKELCNNLNSKPNDIIFIIPGDKHKTLNILGNLRLEIARTLNLIDNNVFKCLWVVDFPLLEWDEQTQRFVAMHHPFTSPKLEDIELMDTNPAAVRANAYDFVCNGVELGGGSIRIHDSSLQQKMFNLIGLTQQQAQRKFGYLMNAFKYGAPPHGGIAFGFDRMVSLFYNTSSIKDVIAFPKNNAGRDLMIDCPSEISQEQLDELGLIIKK